jgi:amidophosphoribosyltransferase
MGTPFDRPTDLVPLGHDGPDNHPREACGVFAVFAPGENVAQLTYFGLYALQHRGQESAGIAVGDGESLLVYSNLGLVNQVFDEKVLDGLSGHLAIGHTRYSTTGSSGRVENAQPAFMTRRDGGGIALGHNGNLVNPLDLAAELADEGIDIDATTDSHLVCALLARQDTSDLVEAWRRVAPKLKGAYSITSMDEKRVMAIRDPHGVRPLVIGRLPSSRDAPSGGSGSGGGWVFASETCALDIIGADFIRDVEPGELVVVEEDGQLRSHQLAEPTPRLCVFEFVYFARPDSTLMGRSVSSVRRAMGKQLADEAPPPPPPPDGTGADLVIAVPQCATAAAQGYADRAGLPYADGIVVNRYVGRTFIQPTQSMREQGVRMKLNPIPEVIEGKRLIVVDDSIFRGTTTREVVDMLRRAGAREVHLRVSSPPVQWPCFYGIDIPSRDELVAASRDIEEIKKLIDADSLGYLSIDGMLTSTGLPTERFCHACFSGGYPIGIPEETARTKNVLEAPRDAASSNGDARVPLPVIATTADSLPGIE